MKISEICLKYGGILVNNRFSIITNYGKLFVSDLGDNTFIPMIFDFGFDINQFKVDSHDDTINNHSFKWNLHSSDIKFNLQRLDSRLSFVTRKIK